MTSDRRTILQEFARSVHDRAVQEVEDQGTDMRSTLGRMWTDHLTDQGITDEIRWCSLDVSGSPGRGGILVDGWIVRKGDAAGELQVHLIGVLETATESGSQGNAIPVNTPKKDVELAFQRLERTAELMREGQVIEHEDDPEVSEMAARLRTAFAGAQVDLQLTVITDGTVTTADYSISAKLGATRRVLDIAWLQRTSEAGRDARIDLGEGLECLVAERDEENNPRVLLTIIPGDMLAGIYERHRERLLERNVRSYLQGKVKVNKGISRTIAREPEMFLPFNNGISATASAVEMDEQGRTLIAVEGLQIVNGGQTTASLFAAKRNGQIAQLRRVSVQAKITIVAPELLDELVPRISEYANSQNAIKASDLQANSPWEAEMQRISREHRVSGADGGLTGWYYERARGAYANMVSTEKSRALEWPAHQVLTKADAALLEASWNGSPNLASKGPEAGFVVIAKRRSISETTRPTVDDFERLVALATLRREIQRVVSEHTTSMKPPITNYTIAWIGANVPGLMDVSQICKTGRISLKLISTIRSLVPLVDDVVRNRPVTVAHEGEWPKKEACWHQVKDVKLEGNPVKMSRPMAVVETQDPALSEVERLGLIPIQHWIAAIRWCARERKNNVMKAPIEKTLQGLQAGKGSGAEFASGALRLMSEAMDRGFRPPAMTERPG
jgi:AIPR protein